MEKQYIWTMWWRGEENAPPLVKACLASMRQHANGAEVKVLSKETLQTYIILPACITEKFEEGKISITHLSDMIRVWLLYQYGGLWLDSTVFVTRDIPKDIFERPFYTIRTGKVGHGIGQGRWCTYLLAGEKGNIFFQYLSRMFSNYFKKYNLLFDYLTIDFFMNECYELIPEIKKMVDEVPYYGADPCELIRQLSSDNKLDSVQGTFQKISRKEFYKVFVSENKLSLYGAILFMYKLPLDESKGITKKTKIYNRVNEVWNKIMIIPQKRKEFGFKIAAWGTLALTLGHFDWKISAFCRNHYYMEVKKILRGAKLWSI